MFDTLLFQDQPFSLQLKYSLTAEHFIIAEMTNIQQQTQLLHQISSRQLTNKIIPDQKEVDATRIQNNSRISVWTADAPQSKVSLFNDCRIRRIQEEDQILNQIKKRCSNNCFVKVKQVFQNQRLHNKILKQLQNETQQNYKINSDLLCFRQQNQQLKAQLEKSIQALNAKDDKGKLKVLQQRNMNKQTLILKNQKNIILKQKKVMDMKKKIQSIFDHVDQQLQKIYKQINLLTHRLREGLFQDNIFCKDEGINNKIAEIAQLWCQFGSSFKSKLQ